MKVAKERERAKQKKRGEEAEWREREEKEKRPESSFCFRMWWFYFLDPVLFTGTIRSNLDPPLVCSDERLWEVWRRTTSSFASFPFSFLFLFFLLICFSSSFSSTSSFHFASLLFSTLLFPFCSLNFSKALRRVQMSESVSSLDGKLDAPVAEVERKKKTTQIFFLIDCGLSLLPHSYMVFTST